MEKIIFCFQFDVIECHAVLAVLFQSLLVSALVAK